MRIEKISRIVPIATGTSGRRTTTNSTVRNMLLSIPRVRFLEGGETEYYHKFTAQVDDEIPTMPYGEARVKPLTEREKDVVRLKNTGMTILAIAKHFHVRPSTISKSLSIARAKIDVIRGGKNETDRRKARGE